MILNHTILTGAQEQDLIARIHEGDRDAQATLLESNERLIYKTAKKFIYAASPDVELDDLMQEGRRGLLHAAQKYSFKIAKKRKVTKFSTYASWWVYQYIRRYACRHRSGFSRSVELDDLSYIVQRIKGELLIKLRREPTHREIAGACNIPIGKIKAILSTPLIIHLDAPGRYEDETENHEGIPDPQPDIPEAAELSIMVGGYLSALEGINPRHAQVIRMLFGLNQHNKAYTMAEVAQKLSITRQRVQQIKEDALEKLRSLNN